MLDYVEKKFNVKIFYENSFNQLLLKSASMLQLCIVSQQQSPGEEES